MTALPPLREVVEKRLAALQSRSARTTMPRETAYTGAPSGANRSMAYRWLPFPPPDAFQATGSADCSWPAGPERAQTSWSKRTKRALRSGDNMFEIWPMMRRSGSAVVRSTGKSLRKSSW